MKRDIRDILFWIFISVSVFLFLWRVFGDSPTADIVLYPALLALTMKMWGMGEDMAMVKARLAHLEKQFSALAHDFKEHLKRHP